MKKIKWGVIGCGGIADRKTIPGMMLANNVELVSVMDADIDIAEKVKEKYNAIGSDSRCLYKTLLVSGKVANNYY